MKALPLSAGDLQGFSVSNGWPYLAQSFRELTSAVYFRLLSNHKHLHHLPEGFPWQNELTLPADTAGWRCCSVMPILRNSPRLMGTGGKVLHFFCYFWRRNLRSMCSTDPSRSTMAYIFQCLPWLTCLMTCPYCLPSSSWSYEHEEKL